jgi:hypothetical protein
LKHKITNSQKQKKCRTTYFCIQRKKIKKYPTEIIAKINSLRTTWRFIKALSSEKLDNTLKRYELLLKPNDKVPRK